MGGGTESIGNILGLNLFNICSIQGSKAGIRNSLKGLGKAVIKLIGKGKGLEILVNRFSNQDLLGFQTT